MSLWHNILYWAIHPSTAALLMNEKIKLAEKIDRQSTEKNQLQRQTENRNINYRDRQRTEKSITETDREQRKNRKINYRDHSIPRYIGSSTVQYHK